MADSGYSPVGRSGGRAGGNGYKIPYGAYGGRH